MAGKASTDQCDPLRRQTVFASFSADVARKATASPHILTTTRVKQKKYTNYVLIVVFITRLVS